MKTHQAIKMYFERKRKSSPGFSVRSLARRLDISPSFLSRAINGKKALPTELLGKLATALDVEPELLVPEPITGPARKVSEVNSAVEDWTVANKDTLQILRSWYYLPILEFTTLTNFDGSAAMIARRLKISPTATELALKEMMALGLLKLEKGRYCKVDRKIRFTSAKSIALIRHFHDEMLEKGQQELRTAISEEEYKKRFIAGITISANPEAVEAAKRKLSECLYQIANDLTEAPGSEVYHLGMQLIPLTKG